MASTSYTNDNADVGISGAATQTIDMSNTFTVGLYEDSAHATAFTTIPVGSKVYAKLTPPGLPSGIKAYYEKCVITDGTSTFNVFDNYKCKSTFAQVAQDNVPADTYTDFQFDFIAFAFVNQQAASYDLVSFFKLDLSILIIIFRHARLDFANKLNTKHALAWIQQLLPLHAVKIILSRLIKKISQNIP